MLKSKDIWKGMLSYDGQKSKYLKKVDTAAEWVTSYIKIHTKLGPVKELYYSLL